LFENRPQARQKKRSKTKPVLRNIMNRLPIHWNASRKHSAPLVPHTMTDHPGNSANGRVQFPQFLHKQISDLKTLMNELTPRDYVNQIPRNQKGSAPLPNDVM
jgi:hypothetical protein